MTSGNADQLSNASSDEHAPAPGARIALVLLLTINLFNYVDRYVLAAVEPKIQDTFFPHSESDPAVLGKMGLLATAFFVTYMAAAPIFGWLADRMSRWLLVGVSVLLWSVATGGSGLASTFALLMTMRLFVGVGEAGYGPSAPTIISDLYPVSRRGSVLAWFYMAIPVGSALGYILGGWIGSTLGWRWAFLIVTPPGLLLGAFCFFMKDPRRAAGGKSSGEPTKPKLKDYVVLLKTRSYVFDCAGMIAMTFAIGGISFWIPKYMSDIRHAGTLAHVNTLFGAITVVAGVSATLLGGMAGDALKKKFSGSYFLVSGIGIILACPFIWLMVHIAFPWAWVMLFFAEFCLFFNTGPSNTILANVTHPSIRSTAFALNIFIIHILGDVPSPPLLGHIAGRFGWDAAFGVVIAATAIGGVFWMFGIKYLAADTAAAPFRLAEPTAFPISPISQ